jgi:hypothetical protein
MSRLAEQQQILLDALFAWPPDNAMKVIAGHAFDTGSRGLKAYQTNGHVLAERALQGAYPVVAQLLGTDSFAALARALWHAHPPHRGDIAQWGDMLPKFVQTSAQLQDEPYLTDVALAEWTLHQCAAMANATPQLSTLALLTTHDPAKLSVELASGCSVLRSPWPLASLLGAHLYDTPGLQEVGQQLRGRVAQDALIWRAGLRPRVREAAPGEFLFIQSLLKGDSVSAALDGAPLLDFTAWLPVAVHSGLFVNLFEMHS